MTTSVAILVFLFLLAVPAIYGLVKLLNKKPIHPVYQSVLDEPDEVSIVSDFDEVPKTQKVYVDLNDINKK
jgi:hypothetical protein